MKKSNIIKSLTAALAVLLTGSVALTGCSNDDTAGAPAVKEGVVFNFKRKTVYATGIEQFGSVKITVSDGTKRIELPSSRLQGDENVMKTVAFSLPAGDYKLLGYKAYNKKQDPLFEIELDSLNEFMVVPQSIVSYTVPVKVRKAIDQSTIRNALLGLCLEVFGEDKTTWPWDPSPDKYPYPDWEGLEFEFDDYDNPMYISGLFFDAQRNGKETGWTKMTAIPDGTISNMGTIMNITINDLPDFKSLPGDLDRMPSLGVITITNSGIEELPANLSALTALNSLTIVNCPLKEAPAGLSALTDLRLLHLRGTQITKLESSLSKLTRLESLDLSHNPITSVGEGTLPAADGKLIELRLDHTNLSSLPSEIGRMTYLRSINLEGCQFTSIPAQVKGNTGIKGLYIGQNPLTVSAADFANMSDLETLFLNGVKMTSLPKLTLPKLLMLDITGCGLTSTPDLSGMTNLRSLKMGDNAFTTFPERYFAANKKLRLLTLSNSPRLTSMPDDLGLVARVPASEPDLEGMKEPVKDGYKERFKWLEVENCPSLTWVTPAAWRAFDGTSKTYEPKTRRPDFPDGSIYDEYFGRVAVYRTGSPNITLGK